MSKALEGDGMMWGLSRRRFDLIPLVAQPDWELDGLFEARGEQPHQLTCRELAERCAVDHESPSDGARFGSKEMCENQWVCVAAYYAWVDEEARARQSRHPVATPRRTPALDHAGKAGDDRGELVAASRASTSR
jgi:hypothetical protein